ncbi:MAG: MCE family protein [Candidatus Omnitrophica bacterium]|nr:MCE family protein [Candidatus Omnitrophota bacterium]
MSREGQLELKVGGFVLLAVLSLSFFVVSVCDLSFIKKGHGLSVIFGFANGLREAAPVRLAGVEAGIVKKIRVFVDEKDNKKTKVHIDLWIQEGVEIPVDSKITINQLGLLGEKYIEIVPGVATEDYKSDSLIVGADPLPIEKITEQVAILTNKLEMTVDSINNGILTDQNKKSLADMLQAFDRVANDIKNGHGTVGRLFTDESIYNNLDELTADLKVNPWKLLYRPKK